LKSYENEEKNSGCAREGAFAALPACRMRAFRAAGEFDTAGVGLPGPGEHTRKLRNRLYRERADIHRGRHRRSVFGISAPIGAGTGSYCERRPWAKLQRYGQRLRQGQADASGERHQPARTDSSCPLGGTFSAKKLTGAGRKGQSERAHLLCLRLRRPHRQSQPGCVLSCAGQHNGPAPPLLISGTSQLAYGGAASGPPGVLPAVQPVKIVPGARSGW
jgi:hypothetical protein